jgi:type VI secretion system protein ImpL
VRGVGGTRSFVWWLSEEAVILDMAGRTLGTAAYDDSDDWIAFLEVLKRQRKRDPINGVLVALSVDQVAGPEAKLDTIARGARERVRELIRHLGVVFPVYIVVTQSDRIAGFAEFFGDLPAGERRQVWGATLAVDAHAADEADRALDAEFGQLVAALSDVRLERLAAVPDPAQRARAFAFPLQLDPAPDRGRDGHAVRRREAARADIRAFFRDLLQCEIVDLSTQPVVAELGGAAARAVAPPQVGNGAFFVSEMMTEVVFPDASLVTESTRASTGRRRRDLLVLGGLGILLVAFTILFSTLSCANGRLIDRARRAAREAADQVHPGGQLMPNLTVLEELRKQTAILDSLARHKPFLRRVGGYAGDAVRDPAMQLYVEKSLEALIAPAAKAMEADLTRLTSTGEGAFIDYYFLFRAWRLLTDPRQITADDAPILTRELVRTLGPQLYSPTPEDRERFPQLLAAQVGFLTRHVDLLAKWAPAYYAIGDRELIARGSERIRRTWDSSQFYRRMLDGIGNPPKPVTLGAIVGGASLLGGGGQVGGFYTREGWEKEVKPRIEWYRLQMQRDWVVGEAFAGHPPDVGEALLDAYARDYVGAWSRFLDAIVLVPIQDLQGAEKMVAAAGQDDSPILKVLHEVATQTEIPADPRSALARIGAEFEIAHDFFATPGGTGNAAKVGSFLSQWLQRLRGQSPNVLDTNRPPSSHYLDLVRAADKEVAKAAQPGAPATDIQRLTSYGTDITNPVKGLLAWVDGLAQNYPDSGARRSVARLLKLPIEGVQGGGKDAIVKLIAPQWQLLVKNPFQLTLAGKYPFDESGPDATLNDFVEFFRPGGTFWSFYNSFLKDYMLEDGSPSNPATSSPFPPRFTAFVRRAYEIRQSFFAAGEKPTLKFSVRAQPPSYEGQVPPQRIALEVGGHPVIYTMGVQQWAELEWPGAEPNLGASVTAVTSKPPQPPPITAPGPWGLFHVLDKGQFSQVESPTPLVTWTIPGAAGKISVSYEFQPGSSQHPFKPGYLRGAVPDSL